MRSGIVAATARGWALRGALTALAALAAGSTGCARSPIVQSELPITRVVVYRNGVAYFERAGMVEGDQVRFKMRQAEVGDFLATLAVLDEGRSSVHSAAFPLPDPSDKPKDGKDEDPEKVLRVVSLALDGRAHRLQVGYVAAAPVWRPSYRLVVLPGGHADLQGWGIVENLSGEDWTGVSLSLVAGAPIAFDAQLGTPVIPPRPIVTDSGEVILAVPKSETSLADRDSDGIPDKKDADEEKNRPAPATAAAPPPPPGAQPQQTEVGGFYKYAETGKPKAPAADAPNDAYGRPVGGVETRPARTVSTLAAIAVQGGTTSYRIPNAITIKDKSATMVPLLAQRLEGEAVYLFAPDDGVPDSASHPFHAVRFLNETGGVLERGPIAVLQDGSFVGQGLLDPLSAGAYATVKFALERALAVDSEQKNDVQGTRLSKIENSALWLEHDVVLKTTYHVQNGTDLPASFLVKHRRLQGSRLFDPPPKTEDNVGTGSALVPLAVPAQKKAELVVDERSVEQDYADWFGVAADKAVQAYVADPRADVKVAKALMALWPSRAKIVAKQEEAAKTRNELAQLQGEAGQKRADLHAIEKNKAAEALRRSLTARIGVIAAREEVLTAQGIQVAQDLSELQTRWRADVGAIHLAAAPPPPTK